MCIPQTLILYVLFLFCLFDHMGGKGIKEHFGCRDYVIWDFLAEMICLVQFIDRKIISYHCGAVKHFQT